MAQRDQRLIFDVAPIAGEVEPPESGPPSAVPSRRAAAPSGVKGPPPLFRPLKVYAFGPSRGRAHGNLQSIAVRYEKLAPGPVGERISVVDYDITRDCYYDPVDLDDPHIAINGGLDPSESDTHFHQQMAYAVVSESLRRIEVALGRTVLQRSPEGTKPLRVIIHPHYAHMTNAHSMEGHMMLGYFRAGSSAQRHVSPGQTVFTCLSADVVGHETTHVVLWRSARISISRRTSTMPPSRKPSRISRRSSSISRIVKSCWTRFSGPRGSSTGPSWTRAQPAPASPRSSPSSLPTIPCWP